MAGSTGPGLELLGKGLLGAHRKLVELARRFAEDALVAGADSLENPEKSLLADTQLAVDDMAGTVEWPVELLESFGEVLFRRYSG